MAVMRGYIWVQTLKTMNDGYGNQVCIGGMTYRMMGRSELENWVALQICDFNRVHACKVKKVYRREIYDIANLIFSYLAGSRVAPEQLRNTLRNVIEEYGISVKELRDVSPEKMEEAMMKYPEAFKTRRVR